MRKVFNFIKDKGLLFLAVFFLTDLIFCLITSNPVDDTAKRIFGLTLGMDMLWFIVLLTAFVTKKLYNDLNKVYDVLINLYSTNENLMHALQSLQDKVEALEEATEDKQQKQQEKKVE